MPDKILNQCLLENEKNEDRLLICQSPLSLSSLSASSHQPAVDSPCQWVGSFSPWTLGLCFQEAGEPA